MSETETKTIKYKHPNITTGGVPRKSQRLNIMIEMLAYPDLDLEVPETVGRWENRFLESVDIRKDLLSVQLFLWLD